mmetsp:Transcript_3972/g.6966  ORF Transcript_3972/g.6966 Transcript_3972/m.6966 type:complete len:1219 (-) Transcript_3972:182-3838(-)
MHIKQVIIDGFKSYASRTVVHDFDPQFNAITGLNGSGKSNILDAICFVLGITQLSQVRVSNLQGLVYKQGQSGVTTASVQIVFDNSDASCSPMGYEHDSEITVTRQVAIGGRNKYLINGKNAQAKQVQTLFHSVQLNVNNPHFLIMQGRITKVLNMKPPEILGMIEEAAGTRMFETKKLEAEKKMDQKQVKVDEIEKILAEEITPKLDKLRNEKQAYLKWSQQNAELERLQRYAIAYRYVKREKSISGTESRGAELEAQMEQLTEKIQAANEELKELREKDSSADSVRLTALEAEIEQLAAEEADLHKAFVKANTVLENKAKTLQKLLDKLAQMENRSKGFQSELQGLEAKEKSSNETLEAVKASYQAAKKGVENAQIGLQAANAGLDNDSSQPETQQLTMEEKLVGLRATSEEASTTIKQSEMKLKHSKKELVSVSKQVKAAGAKDSKGRKELESQLQQVQALRDQVSKLGYDPEEFDSIRSEISEKEEALHQARDVAEAVSAQLGALRFDFADPHPNFDRSKVKGMVAELVTVQDNKHASALEVVAGGRLYQVVVDAVATGKALLDKGKLKKRVTIIPLDKVSSRPIPQPRVTAAARIAKERGGDARPALALVGYDEEVSKAMEYVFGTTLVCDSLATARAVTFNKQVQVKSVTLDGDAFDPQGTLSGGSRPNRGSVLVQLGKFQAAKSKVIQLQEDLERLQARFNEINGCKSNYQELAQQLNLAEQKLQLVEERMKDTPFAQLKAKESDLQNTVVDLEDAIEEAHRVKKEATEQANVMEEEMKDMDAARSRLIEKAQIALKEAKDALVEEEKRYEVARDQAENAAQDIETLVQEQDAMVETIASSGAQIAEAEEDVEQQKKIVQQAKEAYDEASLLVEEKKDELAECRVKLTAKNKAIANCNNLAQTCELKIKELQGEASRLGKSRKDAEKELRSMRGTYPWIAKEQQFFGKPHTDYDFAARDPEQVQLRLRELEKADQSMSSSINKKVMGMIGKAEQEYEDLQSKRTIIEKDRQTIERVIHGLEAKKNEALKTTWGKVNKDFGSIFSTLLPGTQAKLDLTETQSILDGLEVKVAFGDTWKKSLSELSGGQRSLLALSLILALLLFKPAPMYILDEVDAALDLSHTQNIGQMLRTHFAHSQFIVVSLKEGMFNNANVIFKTKFVDGLSTVTRHSNKANVERSIAVAAKPTKAKAGKVQRKRAKLAERDQNVVVGN